MNQEYSERTLCSILFMSPSLKLAPPPPLLPATQEEERLREVRKVDLQAVIAEREWGSWSQLRRKQKSAGPLSVYSLYAWS
jgi:hypothetical protein